MTKRTIPEIRLRVTEIAEEIRGLAPASQRPREHQRLADELDGLVVEMIRQSPIRRARVQSAPVTPEIAEGVRRMAANPDVTVGKIADRFGINQGRVSEILNGKR